MKKNKILLLGSFITGLLACSSLFAQEELLPPAAPKVKLCVRMVGEGPGMYMRKFSYMVNGLAGSGADWFRLEPGQPAYSADLDVSQPGLLKIEEDGNANFNCTFLIRPDTRTINVTINSPPGVRDCVIQTSAMRQACRL